jgi:hypothetical protein
MAEISEIKELVVPLALELSRSVDAVVKEMEAITVSTQGQYDWMSGWLRRNKDTQKAVDEFFEGERVEKKAAYDDVLARKGAFKKPLEAADAVARRKMSVFATEQEKVRRAAQAKADEEARKRVEDDRLLKAEELSAMGRTDQADAVMERSVTVKAAPVMAKVGKTMEVWTVEVADLSAFLAEASGLNQDILNCITVNVTALAAVLKRGDCRQFVGLKVSQTFRPVL